VTPEAAGRAAAEAFRAEHRLGQQALGDLVAVIEQSTGVDVSVVDAGDDEHGMTMRDPQRRRVFIAVARTHNPMRQRSTLAHELAHVIFDDWEQPDRGDWDERDPVEQRADAFARHLLVPLQGLKDFHSHPITELADLSAVVQRFLVSPVIASIALRQAALIGETTKQEWISIPTRSLATRFGWSDQYLALADESNRTRAPQRLLARAVRGYAENVVSLSALARLRGVAEAEVEAELAEAGIIPEPISVRWADPADLPPVEVDLSDLEEDLEGPTE